MFKEILKKIENNQKIIIIRHKNPDYDAYGSQFGLGLALKNKYKDKTILFDGDDNSNNFNNYKLDSLTKEDYKDALVILVDQSSLNMLTNDYILYAKDSIILDHHVNNPDFAKTVCIDPSISSAAELITRFLYESKIEIPKEAAEALYTGVIGDSFRFFYKGTTAETFKAASILIDSGADIFECYKRIQKEEPLEFKLFKGYILSNIIVDGSLAYVYVPKDVRDKYRVSVYDSTRGTVNLLSGIEGINVFINFTESDENTIVTEIRSKEINIVSAAKDFGGGGHELACGCTLKSKDDINKLIDNIKHVIGDK